MPRPIPLLSAESGHLRVSQQRQRPTEHKAASKVVKRPLSQLFSWSAKSFFSAFLSGGADIPHDFFDLGVQYINPPG